MRHLLFIIAAGTSPMTLDFCLFNARASDRDNDREDLRELHLRLTRDTDDNRTIRSMTLLQIR